jgi:hypothetical protein
VASSPSIIGERSLERASALEEEMSPHVAIALSAPVFDPVRQIDARFFWRVERDVSVGLTCNIGLE